MAGPPEVPVLVIGGGLTGLSAALFLARQGVPVLVAERQRHPSPHPRARAINPRTMEIFRSAGLEETVRATPSPVAGNDLLVHVESVAGRERLRMPTAAHDDIGQVSPCDWMLIDQWQLEPILLRAAGAHGAEIALGTRVESADADDEGVTARLVDAASGAERRVRATYVIVADGVRGRFRRQLGIRRAGPPPLTHIISIFFRADLSTALRGRQPAVCYVNNETVRGALLSIDNDRRWVFNLSYFPDRGQRPEDYGEEQRIAVIRAAVGDPGLDVTLERRDDPPWELIVGIAERMRAGRAFLAGDAAHSMPPTGAFGANTGIQEAHNLAWKIAWVRRGAAGPGLLDTYEEERRPIAEALLAQAMARFDIRQGKSYEDVAPRLTDEITAVFGHRYRTGALAAEPDAASAGGPFEDPRHPTGRPGTRAPHLAVTENGRRRSLLDLYGSEFMLVAGARGEAWADAARRVAPDEGLTVRRMGRGGLADPDGGWPKAHGVTAGGAVLVRPDGFIGWRSREPAPDPVQALRAAMTAVTTRG